MTTRDRLVSTMATSMRERGLGSSAIKDVLQRADVTAGSMYHFFPDGKEQLAAETILRAGAIGHRTLVNALDEADSAVGGVARFFELLGDDLEASDYLLGCPIGVPTSDQAEAVSAARVCVSLYEGASLIARANRDVSVVKDAAGAVRSLLADPKRSVG